MKARMLLKAAAAMAVSMLGVKHQQRFLYEPAGFTYGNSNSKYKPHQGKREIARRAKQIERGILQVS